MALHMFALVLSCMWSMLALMFVEQIGAGGRTKFSALLLLLMLVLEQDGAWWWYTDCWTEGILPRLMLRLLEQVGAWWWADSRKLLPGSREQMAHIPNSLSATPRCTHAKSGRLWRYESFSDVGEIRVYFASKILTPCRMH